MKRELTQAAQAAKSIREELKKSYPGIKFSVVSKNFSMGNAVDINWDLGPTAEEVERITDKYQYGHFNSMEDIYENSNTREDIPQAKFVHCQREIKRPGETWEIANELRNKEQSLMHIMARDLCQLMNIEYAGGIDIRGQYNLSIGLIDGRYSTLQESVYSIFRRSSLLTGYHGIKRTNIENGLLDDLYVMY